MTARKRILHYMTMINPKPVTCHRIAADTGLNLQTIRNTLSKNRGELFQLSTYKGKSYWFKLSNIAQNQPIWTPKRNKLQLILKLCKHKRYKFQLIEDTKMGETTLVRYLYYLRAHSCISLGDDDSYITISNELPDQLPPYKYTKVGELNG
jgi:hypothetical protein